MEISSKYHETCKKLAERVKNEEIDILNPDIIEVACYFCGQSGPGRMKMLDDGMGGKYFIDSRCLDRFMEIGGANPELN